jgi:folate-binding protein YgfZ
LRETPFYSAFLDARGRVLWDVFVWVWPKLVAEKGHWACYVEVDENEAEALKKHLKRHKLRSKVQIEDVGETKVWAAWGSPTEQANTDCIAELADPRGPNMHRYLMSAETELIVEGAQPADVKEYHHQRYKYGIAEGSAEIARESALPMEFNIDLWHGIDFKKGCYVGQELTIRTKHTGIVRKRILPVELSNASDALPEHGTDIKQLDDSGNIKKGRAAGKFIAGMGNVGLALCRLENMTHMKISAEGGSWKPGMEFGCETSKGVVKLSPVLHEWFVLRERELWDKNRTRI